MQDMLKRNAPIAIEIALYILRMEFESSLIQDSRDKDTKVDMVKYIKISELYDTFRSKVMAQIKQQVNFWELYFNQKPHFNRIYKLSLKIFKAIAETEAAWKKFERSDCSNFTGPFLTYGMYQSRINNKMRIGNDYLNEYSRQAIKSTRINLQPELCSETMFHSDNV
mmetsp:Transcript_11474/g.9892  ORF Transcript_11474/g.9892 Transcript_11474/m.9892 type:complete len:167 (+) Transcript_11474:114-614(+)